jgi:hypothetical protein
MGRINWRYRQHLFVGGYFPHVYLAYIRPLPPELIGYLPPVPPGYAMGYYQGYCLIYDPNTLMIISVIDLYRY